MISDDNEVMFNHISEKLNTLMEELVAIRSQQSLLHRGDTEAFWWLQLKADYINFEISQYKAQILPYLAPKQEKPADIIMFPGMDKKEANEPTKKDI